MKREEQLFYKGHPSGGQGFLGNLLNLTWTTMEDLFNDILRTSAAAHTHVCSFVITLLISLHILYRSHLIDEPTISCGLPFQMCKYFELGKAPNK